MMRKNFVAGALALLFFAGSTTISYADFGSGLEAYRSGNYAVALHELKPLADAEQANAQFYLGEMYRRGKGVGRDFKKAMKWYRRAAELGLGSAQLELGAMYETIEDYQNEVIWLEKAAAQGIVEAMSLMGVLYLDELVPAARGGEAVKWFTEAAKHKDVASQYLLGHIYANGLGVSRDLRRAHMWFSLAAGNNMEKAEVARTALEEKMSVGEISSAKDLAEEWLKAQD